MEAHMDKDDSVSEVGTAPDEVVAMVQEDSTDEDEAADEDEASGEDETSGEDEAPDED